MPCETLLSTGEGRPNWGKQYSNVYLRCDSDFLVVHRGAATEKAVRKAYGLDGLLPAARSGLQKEVDRAVLWIERGCTPLDKYQVRTAANVIKGHRARAQRGVCPTATPC